jgi:uncharacterized membrane protein YoaK (UPF0700 family)
VKRFDRRIHILAAGLSGLAGYVDAIGFLKLNGFFVSFMSGNSTLLAVGLARGAPQAAGMAGGLIALFVAGVVSGSVLGRLAGTHRRPAVLGLVTMLLAIAAALAGAGWPGIAIVAMVLAMGAENAVFENEGDVQIGLTYMTGTLVKVGQRATAAAFGGDRFGWAPYLLLWCGLICGAIAGALVYRRIGLDALWFGSLAAGTFAVISARSNTAS